MNIIPDGRPIGGSDRRSGPAYPFGNDPAKIERYRRFWAREPVERPLVGFSLKTWFPMYEFAASRAWQGLDHLTPDMIHPEDFIQDQERLLREGEVIEDDILRGACPSQAVQWLPPMLGAPLRILMESTLAPDLNLSWEDFDVSSAERRGFSTFVGKHLPGSSECLVSSIPRIHSGARESCRRTVSHQSRNDEWPFRRCRHIQRPSQHDLGLL